jgi:endo-1,4-beta-xylanase
VAPQDGRYDFDTPDALVSFAEANGMSVRGHTLLWEKSTPTWALDAIRQSGDWSPIARHFETVLLRYPNIIDWDVVNEPIDGTQPDGLRRDSFYAAFGSVYIEQALRLARQLRPTAKLAINEYGLSYDTPYHAARRSALLRLIRKLRERDVPLDCVGLQSHLDLSAGRLQPHAIISFLEQIASYGLEIVITELDVKEADRSKPLAVRDARVAQEVSDFLTAALSVRAVTGVITWGLSDRHSWLQDELPHGRNAHKAELNRGLPFDSQYRPKPMLGVLQQSLC